MSIYLTARRSLNSARKAAQGEERSIRSFNGRLENLEKNTSKNTGEDVLDVWSSEHALGDEFHRALRDLSYQLQGLMLACSRVGRILRSGSTRECKSLNDIHLRQRIFTN